MNVHFTVPGRPRPQGSKRPFVNKHTGRVQMVESSKHIGEWRARVSQIAAQAMEGMELLAGPVTMNVTFVLGRPKAHYRTGRNAHLLRDGQPVAPCSTPDVDKLLRGVLDALTGTVFADDGQVVAVVARKVFGWPERCEVSAGGLLSALDYGERAA